MQLDGCTTRFLFQSIDTVLNYSETYTNRNRRQPQSPKNDDDYFHRKLDQNDDVSDITFF